MQDLYEILGVDKAADDKDIKKAYRSKVQRSHPDKDNEPDTFHSVTLAYNVLKDSEAREKYDRTGQVDEQAKQNESEHLLAQLFNKMIEAEDLTGNLVQQVKLWSEAETNKANLNIGTNQKTVRILEGMKGRIKSTGEINLFEGILCGKITALESAIEAVRKHLKVIEGMLVILDDYEDLAPKIAEPRQAFANYGTATTTLFR